MRRFQRSEQTKPPSNLALFLDGYEPSFLSNLPKVQSSYSLNGSDLNSREAYEKPRSFILILSVRT